MNRAIIPSLALALLTGGAFAQTAAPAPDAGVKAPPSPSAGPEAGRPGPGAAPPVAGVRPPPPGPMDDAGLGGPPPPDGPRGHRPPPPPPPSKAAHVRIERGDTQVDIKCADDEPMKGCADFTLQLLDKLQAMPTSAPSDSATPKP